jgi:hypothetical protein
MGGCEGALTVAWAQSPGKDARGHSATVRDMLVLPRGGFGEHAYNGGLLLSCAEDGALCSWDSPWDLPSEQMRSKRHEHKGRAEVSMEQPRKKRRKKKISVEGAPSHT